jgi:hypothetical protein
VNRGRRKNTMKRDEIKYYHGPIGRGGWQWVAEVSAEPHPFDDDRLSILNTDEVFQHVTGSRAEVWRTCERFGLEAGWQGDLGYVDAIEPRRRIQATVAVTDLNILAFARVEALVESRDGADVQEHHADLIIVPQQRLPLATPRRVGQQVKHIPQPARRHLLGRLPRYQHGEPLSLAFSLPVPSKPEAHPLDPIYGFNLMLIRAMLRWTADRDLAGRGIRRRAIEPKAA